MPINHKITNPDIILNVDLGTVLLLNTGGAVKSVNEKTGHVVLSALDVSADPLGSAETVKTQLENQIKPVQILAEVNQLNLTKKADQSELEKTQIKVEENRLTLLNKADLTAISLLTTLIDTKANQVYVQEQIANLVNGDQSIINAIQEISTALKDNENLLEALDYTVANRVRFDIANQALTVLQKFNARTNINAEESGTAAILIAQITVQSIGAATAAQGLKANTALQSGDVAPVALSGLFSSLTGQNKIFDVVHSAYVEGTNVAISASDTLAQMLGKLQAQIKANSSANKPVNWIDVKTIATFNARVSLPNTTLKIANINGEMWMKGMISLSSQITANTDPIFAIGNKDWFVTTAVSTANVGLTSCFDLYGTSLSIYNFGFVQAPAINAMRFYCTQNTPSNGSYNFVPFQVGTLINPAVGLV
ncbi:hypothetical protein [Acinetobacter sp. ANC 4648]|uniref:hypothetical protein n=1 Tax=Acinetobacter sp. ANC 4648 TaxID=1977875 RepID=UPI000A34A9F1|nr:hypothetical protein [Acinetobacter sp. ANC 4648]OTG83543.1 hypothetical protein B9T27_03225 [Acinetobacter sp. ANC 4648]